ncbi:MAG: efflux RND transporter periplasmic adaptor subunit [Pirellulaceae bacterium]
MARMRHAVLGLLLTTLVYGTLVAQEVPPSPVYTAEIVEREMRSGQSFVATVEPRFHAILGSAVDGRVGAVLFEEGDRVQEGEPVVEILTANIELQIKAANAQLELYQSQLEELKNGAREEEIEQSEARMAAAEARMVYLDERRKRAIELHDERNVISIEQRDEAVSAADSAHQDYLEAKSALKLMKAGTRIEQIAQAQAQVAMQEAIIGELEDRHFKYTVRSRFTGYVIHKATEVGAWAKSGDPVMEVAHLDTVDVVAKVAERHVPYVTLGDEVEVEISAIPDRRFTGTVAVINPQADVRTRTFPIKVRVQNEIHNQVPLLKSGMMGRVMLSTGQLTKSLMVPKDALVLSGGTSTVYVVQAGAKDQLTVQPVPVTLGAAEGNWIQVTGDLSAGQRVVTRGNERLRPGQSVDVVSNTTFENTK